MARLNPLSLNWKRFVVATSPLGEVIGCGQIKPHKDSGSRVYELASIVVTPAWRGQGVARAIIEHLLEKHKGSLYLTCRTKLGPFYEKFGFHFIESEQMPVYFRRIHRLVRVLSIFPAMNAGLLIMKRGGQSREV